MKNIILVTGPISDGKSFLITGLREEFARRGIPQSLEVISDGKFLLDAVAHDHKFHEGRNHMHEGQQIPTAHYHGDGWQNKYDFVATGREIQTFMFANFFRQLEWIRDSGQIVFAELAGGDGVYKKDNPLAANDYSYARIVDGLNSGEFATEWVPRVLTVLHPSSEFSDRIAWNRNRLSHPPTEDEIMGGRASWGVPEMVMGNTAYDDFPVFQHFLESHGVNPFNIETIHNSGGPELYQGAIASLERQGIGLPPERQTRGKEF